MGDIRKYNSINKPLTVLSAKIINGKQKKPVELISTGFLKYFYSDS